MHNCYNIIIRTRMCNTIHTEDNDNDDHNEHNGNDDNNDNDDNDNGEFSIALNKERQVAMLISV